MQDYPDPQLPGWTFIVDEVFANVYRIDGKHEDGRSVSRVGTEMELEDLWKQVIDDAKNLPQRRRRIL